MSMAKDKALGKMPIGEAGRAANKVVDYWLRKHAKEMRDNARGYMGSIGTKYVDEPIVVAALLRYANAFEAVAAVFDKHVMGSKKTDKVTK